MLDVPLPFLTRGAPEPANCTVLLSYVLEYITLALYIIVFIAVLYRPCVLDLRACPLCEPRKGSHAVHELLGTSSVQVFPEVCHPHRLLLPLTGRFSGR